MNDERDAAAMRLLDVLLEEEIGGDRAEHNAAVVAMAAPRRRARVLRAQRQRRSWLLPAATVLTGMGAVVGTLWLRAVPDQAVSAPQDPLPVEPQSLPHFLELLASCEALTLNRSDVVGATQINDANGSTDRLDTQAWPEVLRITGTDLARWRAAIVASADTTAGFEGIEDVMHVDVELPGQRRLRCFVSVGADRVRFGTGVEDPIVPNATLTTLLRDAFAELDRRHRAARGVVSDAGELRALRDDVRRIDARALAGDVVLAELPRFAALEHLDVRADVFDDASLTAIGRLPKLQRLVLRGAGGGLSGSGFAAFANRPLREVACVGCSGLTRRGVQVMAKLRSLVALCIDGPIGRDGELLADLATFPSLTELAVRSAAFTDEQIDPLLRTKLQRLVLVDANVSGDGLARLAGLPSLRELELVMPALGDADLEGLAELGSLRRLTLRHVRVTDAGLAGLRQQLPACAIECRPGSRLFDTARVLER